MFTGRFFATTIGFALLVVSTAFGQVGNTGMETSPIQDNSFLVEEGYNQERGVVQHISTFSRMWNCKDWSYSFTEEWPAPGNWRHQFSYTLVGMHSGSFVGTGGGLGDTVINYRYQLIGTGETRVAFAPRVSILFATGDVTKGRSIGGTGLQTNLPLSVVLLKRLVSHWNIGGTWVRHAQNSDHVRAGSVGFNFGQSLIYLAHPRWNLLLESYATTYQAVVDRGKTAWVRAEYISPGVRWAFNFPSGLQIVPGVAVPLGIGSSAGERGLFLYLSFEHPFSRLAAR